MVQPVFEKVSYLDKLAQVKEQIRIECKSNVNNESISSILNISPFARIENISENENSVNYNGRITFFVTYLDNDGEIRKCECGSEFSGKIFSDDIKEDSKALLKVNIDKCEGDVSSINLSISAYITIFGEINRICDKNALSGGENIFVKKRELNITKGLGLRKGDYPIEEQLELPFVVEEVLFHQAQSSITAVQSGVGCIIVDGQVHLSLVLLQKNPKKDIIKACKTIPYRMEIECEEAMPSMQSIAFVKEKSIKTDIVADDEQAKSIVNIAINLQFEGETFVLETFSTATDAFSMQNEIKLEKSAYSDFFIMEARFFDMHIDGRAKISELPISANPLALCDEKATILSSEMTDKGLEIVGVYSANLFFKDGEDKFFCRKIEMPIEKCIQLNMEKDITFNIESNAFKGAAKIVSATELAIDFDLYLTIYPIKECKNEVVESLIIGEEKRASDCAISIYIAQKDQELWDLAKAINESPEHILKTNKDLQFPLLGDERIIIYRQK